jgi:flagellin-like hook-associated protein FlgL
MSIRITDGYISSILIGDLNRSLTDMYRQQRMAGSMRRVNEYADDPRGVTAIQRYETLLSVNGEYVSNIARSRVLVDSTDTALQSVSETLADVRVIAMRESSALATTQSMTTAAAEVDGLIARLMNVLNTNIEGSYIFAGTETDAPPFVRTGGTVIYVGNDQAIHSRTGANSVMQVNVTGDTLIGSRSASLVGTTDLAPRLEVTTQLWDLNMGAGWSGGAFEITDGAGGRWQVDMTDAVTVGHVIAGIATATGDAVTATISADGTALELTGAGPIVVSEIDDGSAATRLGIVGRSEGGTLVGRDVRAATGATTDLADIDALAGNLPLGLIEIDWQGATYTVDLGGAATIGDLQAAVAAAVPAMELQIRPSGLVLVGGAPEAFTVRDADATNSASALGLAGDGGPVRLFGVLEDLQASLLGGNVNGIRNSLNELASLEAVTVELLLRNGGRQNDLDWAEQVLLQRDEQLRTNLSLERDADVAEVATQLSRSEAAYQASLLVTSRLFEMNLLKYL